MCVNIYEQLNFLKKERNFRILRNCYLLEWFSVSIGIIPILLGYQIFKFIKEYNHSMILKLKICAYFAVTSSFPIKLFQTCSPFSCLSVSDCNPEGIFANCLLFYRIFVSMLRAIQALSFNVLCFTNNLYKCWFGALPCMQV